MNIDFAKCEFGQEEVGAVNRVLEGYWLASGVENEKFEHEFANYIGTDYAVCVNSGSLANLIALQSLNLPKGSKVMTSACGFPATLSPLLHLGLDPVLVDYNIKTHNIDIDQVILRLPEVKAVMFAHTMGNPVDVRSMLAVANALHIPIIEDCCEAVGAKIDGRQVGSFGKLGTFSFYPAHQITALGGGGMIVTNDKELANECRSLRDWGKIYNWDSYLGDHKTRYSAEINGIPYFKHYTYHSVGYNAKLPEANAAFGREQLKKLDVFVQKRLENYQYLHDRIAKIGVFEDIEMIDGATPSWFGCILTFKDSVDFNRNRFGDYLEDNGIRTRPFFAGNITRHEPFRQYEANFPVADKLMKDSLFVGIWQGLGATELDYMVQTITDYTK